MKKIICYAATLIALVIVPATAQKPAAKSNRFIVGKPTTLTELEAAATARFVKLDTNKDNLVTKAEVDFYKTAVLNGQRDRLFLSMDTDKDGVISRAEFDDGHPEGGGLRLRHRITDFSGDLGGESLIAYSDKDKDGNVTLDEMLNKQRENFKHFDLNQDGIQTPEEVMARVDKTFCNKCM